LSPKYQVYPAFPPKNEAERKAVLEDTIARRHELLGSASSGSAKRLAPEIAASSSKKTKLDAPAPDVPALPAPLIPLLPATVAQVALKQLYKMAKSEGCLFKIQQLYVRAL
jgi:hypothetical protein